MMKVLTQIKSAIGQLIIILLSSETLVCGLLMLPALFFVFTFGPALGTLLITVWLFAWALGLLKLNSLACHWAGDELLAEEYPIVGEYRNEEEYQKAERAMFAGIK